MLASPPLTGVDGRAGVELLEPGPGRVAIGGIDIRAWLLSTPVAELERERC